MIITCPLAGLLLYFHPFGIFVMIYDLFGHQTFFLMTIRSIKCNKMVITPLVALLTTWCIHLS